MRRRRQTTGAKIATVMVPVVAILLHVAIFLAFTLDALQLAVDALR